MFRPVDVAPDAVSLAHRTTATRITPRRACCTCSLRDSRVAPSYFPLGRSQWYTRVDRRGQLRAILWRLLANSLTTLDMMCLFIYGSCRHLLSILTSPIVLEFSATLHFLITILVCALMSRLSDRLHLTDVGLTVVGPLHLRTCSRVVARVWQAPYSSLPPQPLPVRSLARPLPGRRLCQQRRCEQTPTYSCSHRSHRVHQHHAEYYPRPGLGEHPCYPTRARCPRCTRM